MRSVSVLAALMLAGAPPFHMAAHDRISTKVSWDREIAPIVQARCASCHRDGGRAPMALTTYEEARPWAKAIKEEVLTRRMPKWHVVRGYGDFVNDPSLSPFEVALIASWADGGAPRTLPSSTLPTSNARLPIVKVPTASSELSTAKGAKTVSVSCASRTWPAGRVVGIKPALEKGAALRVIVTKPDGVEEPLIWVRDFDPAFAETYWLRNPLVVTASTRLTATASGACTLTALYESRTAR
jgi:hypothetical protein